MSSVPLRSLGSWQLLLASLLFLLPLFCLLASSATAAIDGDGCGLPFGAAMGSLDGVVAYSNCNDTFVSHQVSLADRHGRVAPEAHPDQRSESSVVPIGMKWQCVEFARRYLLARAGVVFGDVGSAFEIWRFNFVHEPHNTSKHRIRLSRFHNGRSHHIPRRGDVVVWERSDPDMPHGHVAIAARATKTELLIAEQNFHSAAWGKEKDYARALQLRHNASGYTAIDPFGFVVLGWMRLDREVAPSDEYVAVSDDEL